MLITHDCGEHLVQSGFAQDLVRPTGAMHCATANMLCLPA